VTSDELITWIIEQQASADTVRSFLADRGVDAAEIHEAARGRIRDMAATVDTDPTVTAEAVRAVRVLVDATAPATEPENSDDTGTGDDAAAELEATDDADETENTDDGGGAVTLENDQADSNDVGGDVPVTGDLISAEAFKARGGGGRRDPEQVKMTLRPGAAASFANAKAANDYYQAFAGGSGGELHTMADLTRHVDRQMDLLRNAGSSAATGIELVQFKAREGANPFRVGANMSRQQAGAVLQDAIAYHSEKFANGFCSPSTQLYEFCRVPAPWGRFGDSIPMIAAERGGVELPVSPSIGTMWGAGIECRTEQEEIERDQDGTEKACTHIDCPTWVDHRNRICHICVTSGTLQRKAFPESIDDAIRKFELIYDMWINWQMLSTAIEIADSQNGELRWDTAGWGILQALKEKIGFAIMSISARTLLNYESTIWNVAIPFWAYAAIQADAAKRVGADLTMMTLTRDPINTILSNGMTVRFWPQMPWQTALVDVPDPAMRTWIGSDVSLENGVYPDTMELLIWPQGTFAGVRDDFLDIRARWDFDLQKQNRQLEWFAETEWNLIPHCYEAVHLTLDICTAGRSGSLFEYPCGGGDAGGAGINPVTGLTAEELTALRALAATTG